MASLREAMGLWRGAPLASISGDWAARMRESLRQQRLDAAIAWADAELRLGHTPAVIAALPDLVAEYPLAEPLEVLLMRALHAVGREAEALDRYTIARRRLVEELGTEPGSGLRAQHHALLRGAPPAGEVTPPAGEVTPPAGALTPSAGPPPPATAEEQLIAAPERSTAARIAPPPAQLPPDVHGFTGRVAELERLDALLANGAPAAVVISAVSGTAGVGKTALAVRWARRVSHRFPDGQLYVDLRGYDPDRPMPAAEALAGFLRALGVPAQDIAQDTAERAAAYRTLLDRRQMLLVLDNAATVEQIRLLLPGTPSCAVLVTSRDSLPALVARHGARRIELDLLPLDDAIALLATLVGHRIHAEPIAAVRLAEQCARLPLALRVAAELVAARPAAALAVLVAELADVRRRLDLLDAGGEPRTAVRSVFSWSYQHLTVAAARTFRLLGLHPGTDVDPHAVAALSGTDLAQARQLLDLLDRTHLIRSAGAGRYTMHDLLRAYAAGLAATEDSDDDRRAALTRLLDHCLVTAAASMDTVYPAGRGRRSVVARLESTIPPVDQPGVARAWLDRERSTLVALTALAAGHGWPGHATDLTLTVHRHLEVGGHYADAIAMSTHAERAAGDAGDRRAVADVLTRRGQIHKAQGRYDEAADLHRRAIDTYRGIDDRSGTARALNSLASVEERQGRYPQAGERYREALSLYREIDHRGGEAAVLNNLANVYRRLGAYRDAAEHYRQARVLFHELGERANEARAIGNLGGVDWRQGRYRRAADRYRQAIDIFRAIGDPAGEAYALAELGIVYERQYRYELAIACQREALDLHRTLGDLGSEAEALNGLGEALAAAGRPDLAMAEHTAAFGSATQVGDRYEQARASRGLGRACHLTGDVAEARHHWQHALAAFAALDVPEAAEVRAWLAALDEVTPAASSAT